MVVSGSAISGDEIVEINQSFQEQKIEDKPAAGSLIDPEGDSFVNSLFDHDFLREWMNSDCGSECHLLNRLEDVELNVMSFEEIIAKECLKLDSTGDLGSENSEMETGGDVSRGKVMVEDGAARDGCGYLRNQRCSIEEGMGKVNLDGETADLDVAKEIAAKEGGVDNVVQSVGDENEGGNGNENVVAGQDGDGQPEIIDGNHDQESDEDKSDSDSESDDESESESDVESEREGSCSSSYSSSDDEEEEETKDIDGEQEGEKEEGELVESDIEDGSKEFDKRAGGIRSKNELTDEQLPPVPPVDMTLLPQHEMQPVGAVSSVLGIRVIIEGFEKHNPLNEGSILWITESRAPLGFVDETFGPVKLPYYIVRYNSEGEVPIGIQPGTLVSFVPEFANYAFDVENIDQKGYDASGPHDEELLEDEEFSDDEKEAEHKRQMEMKKRRANGEKNSNKKKSKNRRKWKRDQSAAAANPQVPSREGNDQSSSAHSHSQPGMVPPFAQTGPAPSFCMPFGLGGSNMIPFQFAAANPQIPLGQGNDQSSSGQGHGHGQPGMVPPFAQTEHNPSFNMPFGGSNVIPFQSAAANPQVPLGHGNDQNSFGRGHSQPGMVPPFRANPCFNMPSGGSNLNQFQMPWMPMVHPQPSYQMPPPYQQIPLQSRLPFQQQIDSGPNLPLNPIPPGWQSGISVMQPGFQPQPTFLNQGMQNPSPPFVFKSSRP